jgi:hypothetical protein
MGEEVSRTDPFSSHLNVDNKWGGEGKGSEWRNTT